MLHQCWLNIRNLCVACVCNNNLSTYFVTEYHLIEEGWKVHICDLLYFAYREVFQRQLVI